MAATFGTLVCLGASGRTYNIDMSIPDAVDTAITFASTGLSATTSPTTWRCPEKLIVIDFCLATAPTAVGASFYSNSAPISGASVRYDGILNTAVNRTPMKFHYNAGDLLSITQF